MPEVGEKYRSKATGKIVEIFAVMSDNVYPEEYLVHYTGGGEEDISFSDLFEYQFEKIA